MKAKLIATIILTNIISVGILSADSHERSNPTWTKEQNTLWDYIEQSWVDDVAKNGKWPANYAHDSFIAWADDYPGPVSLEKDIEWNRIDDESNTVVWRNVTPLKITIEGDTAIVMYYADLLIEDKDGDRERVALGIVEILFRKGKGWEYLASTSFTPKFSDD